jgi:hypothetical protein
MKFKFNGPLRDRNEFKDDERDRRKEGNDKESCQQH